MSDVLDILELPRDAVGSSGDRKAPPKRQRAPELKKPPGLNREVYALLDKDSGPLIPTDFANYSLQAQPYGYKKTKANLTSRRVVKWNWIPFTNPARKDGFQLYHWRREGDEHKEYPFAKMNVKVNVPSYTDAQYQELLQSDDWSRAETDHLFSLCRRYDLRFITIQDRWDITQFKDRSVEDIKERYYSVSEILTRNQPGGANKPPYVFDAEHERKRKEQLKKLYNRTPEEVEEEQQLIAELRKIEQRKKEREKKTQDLQNLIMAADTSCELRRGQEQHANQSRPTSGTASTRSSRKKAAKVTGSRTGQDLSKNPAFNTNVNIETTGIKFPEPKTTGIWLRSSRMKLPSSVGQKRMKAIDQLLRELNLDPHPMPTEEICRHFNELRSDMVLLYELKMALTSLDFDLQSYKHQFEASKEEVAATTTESPAKGKGEHSGTMTPSTPIGDATGAGSSSLQTVIDISDPTPTRKRKAALEQANMMRKLKKNSS